MLLLVRGRQLLELPGAPPRKFDLGPIWGPVSNVVGLAFAAFTTVFFLFPPVLPVTANNMNYTVVVFSIIMTASTITWWADGRKNFQGPKGMETMMAHVKQQYWTNDSSPSPQ